jgi:hypothetical protein
MTIEDACEEISAAVYPYVIPDGVGAIILRVLEQLDEEAFPRGQESVEEEF